MFPYHHSQPLSNNNSHQNLGCRQNSVTHSASTESISDHASIWRPARRDYHPSTFAESTHSLHSSAEAEYTLPGLGSEPRTSHAGVQPSVLEPCVTSKDEEILEEQKQGARWHPFWLRQAMLCSFCAAFLCCTIALPIMLSLSKRNNGLFESRQGDAYVWRFGPTAILTIFSIFWSRVEFQALRYWPWMAMRTGQDLGPAGYNLDYTQMLSPAVLIKSLRRKHFLVFLVATASMILKVQIIISPALYQLHTTQSSTSVDVEVLDSFAVTEDLNNATGTGPYYHARALQNFDMEFPFGVAKEGAYQTFRMQNQTTTARGTVNTPLTVTVDGVFTHMECRELKNHSIASRGLDKYGFHNFTIDLQFEDCEQSVRMQNTVQWQLPNVDTAEAYWTVNTTLKPTFPCSSLPQQNPNFIYYAANYVPSADNVSIPHLDTCAAVICSPTAYISKVEIVDDGISPKMISSPTQKNTTIHSNPWDMLQNAVPDVLGYVGISATSRVTGPVEYAYGFRGKDVSSTDMSLYQSKVLLNSIMNLTEQVLPMLSHYQLRQTATTHTAGSLVVEPDKLYVNEFVCIWMTGLFAVITCIAFWVIFQSRIVSSVWHRDPATILGTLLFFQSDTKHTSEVVKSISGGRNDKKAEWSHSNYSPLALRPWFRTIFMVFVVGLIVGLAVALNASNTSDGLATVDGEGFFYLLSKSLPTLAMLLVSMYVAFNDTVMRDLATLSKLSSKSCDSQELDKSLLDMLGFRALSHSVRLKVYSVTVSQILATLCAFLTTIAAALLTSQVAPASTSSEIQQESWFGYRQLPPNESYSEEYSGNREDIGSLLLARRLSNFTYPQNTYADLVFPVLGINDTDWNANTSARVHTPAAKLLPTCIQLSETDFEMSIKNDSYTGGIEVHITLSFTCPNGSVITSDEFISVEGTITDNYESAYIAELARSPGNVEYTSMMCHLDLDDDAILSTPWGLHTYMWGQYSVANMNFDHFSAWQCNYSWAEVSAEVNLIWGSDTILIDHQNPPTHDNSSVKRWSPPFSFPELGGAESYLGLSDPFPEIEITDPRAGGFSKQFGLLVEPFGTFQVEDFGKLGQEQNILDALHSNLGFVGAQLANIEYRLGIDEKSAATPPVQRGNLPSVNATITDNGRLRLVQNATLTFVLIGVLSLVVVVNAWALASVSLRQKLNHRPSWLLDLDMKGIAPEGFSSIAMMESLMHGSNFLRDVPPDAYPTSSSELHQWLAGTLFRIGWFQRDATNEKEFTLGVLEDEDFEFLGDKDDVKVSQESTREI
ncbi:hypothetical protein B0J13DRAFT_233193 [Dactylonectria estremocensis]|uniref:Uncharacterized protein n=1 Tax=Dactylonectria estremocensis TaxID=1079267 RepID=A0A9P9JF24_9HYPO|nr:hypothetical protein B0J13DRAFT_233193 [Dactylonectria estremocensis]